MSRELLPTASRRDTTRLAWSLVRAHRGPLVLAVLAFAVAGLAARGETFIEDSQCVDVSYPEFFQTLDQLA